MSPTVELGAMDAAFASLGRAVLVVDAGLTVVWAGSSLDEFVCPDARSQLLGRPVSDLLETHVFSAESGLLEVIEAGGRSEGLRAFLRCPQLGSRLVSLSVAGLHGRSESGFPASAHALIVIRPAEDDHQLQLRSAGEMGFVARSAAMLRVVQTIEQLQHSEVPVLITGESGTGKQVVARAIHASSLRRAGPFELLDCASLTEVSFEHEPGSPELRGVARRVERAREGTLFLDEVGELSLDLQARLLRLLRDREAWRSSDGTAPPSARIIASACLGLDEAVARGHFRKDLFYRLRVMPLHLPPLRERSEDIEPLARHLLACIGSREGRVFMLQPDVLQALELHRWPGNVRELENALESAVVLCQGGRVHAGLLPSGIEGGEMPQDTSPGEAPLVLVGTEAERIRAALQAHPTSRAAAAASIGMSRTTLWRRMRELDIS